MSFSSSSIQRSSPGVPFSAWRRRAVRRRHEADVAAAAAAAARDDQPVASASSSSPTRSPRRGSAPADHRPRRDANDDVRGAATVGLCARCRGRPGWLGSGGGGWRSPRVVCRPRRPGRRRRPCPRRRRRGRRAERVPRGGTSSRRRRRHHRRRGSARGQRSRASGTEHTRAHGAAGAPERGRGRRIAATGIAAGCRSRRSTITSKWTCGPVHMPVQPTPPMPWPAADVLAGRDPDGPEVVVDGDHPVAVIDRDHVARLRCSASRPT